MDTSTWTNERNRQTKRVTLGKVILNIPWGGLSVDLLSVDDVRRGWVHNRMSPLPGVIRVRYILYTTGMNIAFWWVVRKHETVVDKGRQTFEVSPLICSWSSRLTHRDEYTDVPACRKNTTNIKKQKQKKGRVERKRKQTKKQGNVLWYNSRVVLTWCSTLSKRSNLTWLIASTRSFQVWLWYIWYEWTTTHIKRDGQPNCN